MKQARHHLAVITAALVWMTLFIALYFWVYKPINPPMMRAVGGALLDLGTMVVFAVAAGGLGRRILRAFDFSTWSQPEHLAASGIIGFAALSLLVLAVGTLLLNSFSIALLLALIAIVCRGDVIGWLRELITWTRTQVNFTGSGWFKLLKGIIAVCLVLALMLALLPPTKWDVLTYHLAGPKLYVAAGHFYAAPNNHFLGFPQVVDVLYAAQMALTGQLTGSSLLHWAIGALMLLMVGGYTARKFNTAAGLAAVCTILVGPSIWLEMTFPYVDLMPMALSIVGLAAAETWADHHAGQKRYIVLLGFIAGSAMGTKYTALWLAIGLGVLIVWLTWRDSWKTSLISGTIFTVSAAAVLAPWLVRNLLWYDNPVYPLVFESAEMDRIRQEWYSQPESGLLYGSDAWQIPILPIVATVFGVEGKGTFGTGIGPLYLILTPMILLAWSYLTPDERRTVIRAAVVPMTVLIIWTAASAFGSYINQQTRLILYAFPPLAVISGIALESLRRLPSKPLNVGFVVRALVAFTLLLTMVDYVQTTTNSGLFPYFSGQENYQERYLERALGWHYAAMQQINDLPEDANVRFLWEPRYLYCDEKINCRPDSLMDNWYYSRRTVADGSPAEIAAQWQREGTEYLLVYEFGRVFERDNSNFYNEADWTAWNEFVDTYLAEQWVGKLDEGDPQYILYAWKAE